MAPPRGPPRLLLLPGLLLAALWLPVPLTLVGRRQLLTAAELGRSGGKGALAAGGPLQGAASIRCGYTSSSVVVDGQEVPVAIWYPAAEAAEATQASEGPYDYFISWGKLFRTLLGLPLPGFVGKGYRLGEPGNVLKDVPAAPSMEGGQPGVVFAHGYLGSRFDMLELCEGLARKGYVVAAPDFAETITASFEPTAGTSRLALLDAVVDKLRGKYGATKLGIVGHSAGGGLATFAQGRFPLGRVAVAGLRPGFYAEDPLLVIASKGDGVIPLNRVLASLPRGTDVKAAKPLALAKQQRLAWMIVDGRGGRPPCHVSFLSPEVGDAMVDCLSPLLGLANLLGVPVLDFDVYRELRDGEATSRDVREMVQAFLLAHTDDS